MAHPVLRFILIAAFLCGSSLLSGCRKDIHEARVPAAPAAAGVAS